MREIRFRGKDQWGNWRYGDLMKNSIPTASPVIVEEFYYDDPDDSMFEVDPATVGQFTGLCDSEGKEIYEGDIIEPQSNLIPVFELKSPDYIVFHDGAFWLSDSWDRHNSKGTLLVISSIYNGIARCKVIGNIHDNPRLLTGSGDNAESKD